MIEIEFDKATSVLAVGDIHGAFKTLNHYINNRFMDSLIIVCGDCGFGFCKEVYYLTEMTKINDDLQKNNNYIAFVRGNHDDPRYFEERIVNLSNIKTIPDYGIIRVCDRNILCVGGAISIDRKYRINNDMFKNMYIPFAEEKRKSYWENEQVVYDENKLNEIVENKINITDVITHSCPSKLPPLDKANIQDWLILDEGLEKDLNEERGNLDLLMDYCVRHFKVENWAYGHFHSLDEKIYSKQNKVDGIKFYFLNMLNSEDRGFDYQQLANKKSNDGYSIKCSIGGERIFA